ncbi:hypothetical protein BOTBODRAFT_34982 [Botryobasidium botryosum FD-172 SS1]|uniref:Uncharacterized protein n=1 Tax=Botryobasidium botryosum (strain FD-172 SS1) TaxID=930990 RepID=A0A067M817_BOTB1|nr:hypothetical protein BOTBODRAFT_34982 [Botryobasidium botryosum FD-172 SS1]
MFSDQKIVNLSDISNYTIDFFTWRKKSIFSNTQTLCHDKVFQQADAVICNTITLTREAAGRPTIQVKLTSKAGVVTARISEQQKDTELALPTQEYLSSPHRQHIEDAINWAAIASQRITVTPNISPTVIRVKGRISPLNFAFHASGRHHTVNRERVAKSVEHRYAEFELDIRPGDINGYDPVDALTSITTSAVGTGQLTGLLMGDVLRLTYKLHECDSNLDLCFEWKPGSEMCVQEPTPEKWKPRASPVLQNGACIPPEEWAMALPGSVVEVTFTIDYTETTNPMDYAFRANVVNIYLLERLQQEDMLLEYARRYLSTITPK